MHRNSPTRHWFGLLPRQSNGLHSGVVVKQSAPIHDAHRTEHDDWFVKTFNRRRMCRIAPFGQCVYVVIH